jgi:hypothetical protein
MPLRYGETAFQAFWHGSKPVVRIYLGDEKIWPDGADSLFTFSVSANESANLTVQAAIDFAFSALADSRVRAEPFFAFSASGSAKHSLTGEAIVSFTFNVEARTANAFSDGFSLGFPGGIRRQVPGDSNGLFALSVSATGNRTRATAVVASITITAAAVPDLGDFSNGFDAGFS